MADSNPSLGKKIRVSGYLMAVPAFINIAISFYVLMRYDVASFWGYMTGTVSSILFSYFWLWQLGRLVNASTLQMFKQMFYGFVGKLVILILLFVAGYYGAGMNLVTFVISFFAGTLLSMFVFIWLLFSMNIFSSR